MSEEPKAQDSMELCAAKRPFEIAGKKKEYRWTEIRVSFLQKGAEVRCLYCKGAVRLHFKQKEDGVEDHCEHKSRQDSEGCRGGHYFLGEHRESLKPVE